MRSVNAGATLTPRTSSPDISQRQCSPSAVMRLRNGVNRAIRSGSTSASQIACWGARTTASARVWAEKEAMRVPVPLDREGLLDVATQLAGGGGRGVAADDPPVATHEELGEVPLDPVAQQPALLLAQPAEERVRVRTVDLDLAEHGEGHAVVALAERADLGLAA